MARTALNVSAARTLTVTSGDLVVTNPTGAAGNPNFALASTAVTPGACGDSTHFPVPTFDSKGRATGCTNQSVPSGTPAGSDGDFQKNTSGAFGSSNLNQNSDGSINASKAVTTPAPNGAAFHAASTTTCDLSASNFCSFTMTGDTTLAVSNPHGSGPYGLQITCTSSCGLTYPSSFTAGNFCAPSTASTKVTTIFFMYDGSANYYQLSCNSTATRSAFPELVTTGAATGKQVVCFDPATGELYGSSTGTACDN
jgi:hypothetical protein